MALMVVGHCFQSQGVWQPAEDRCGAGKRFLASSAETEKVKGTGGGLGEPRHAHSPPKRTEAPPTRMQGVETTRHGRDPSQPDCSPLGDCD